MFTHMANVVRLLILDTYGKLPSMMSVTYLYIYITDAIAGHDPLDSTTYHNRKYKQITLSDEPSVKGLRVGIPKV